MKCNRRRSVIERDIMSLKSVYSFCNQAAEDPSLFKYTLKEFDFEVDMFDIMQYILSVKEPIPRMSELELSLTKDEIRELNQILIDLRALQRNIVGASNSKSFDVLSSYKLEEYHKAIKPYVIHSPAYIKLLIFTCMHTMVSLDNTYIYRVLPSASDFILAIMLEWVYEVLVPKYKFQSPFEVHGERFILNHNANAMKIFYSQEVEHAFVDLNLMSKVSASDYNLATESPIEFARRLHDLVGPVVHPGVPLKLQIYRMESDTLRALSYPVESEYRTDQPTSGNKPVYTLDSNPYSNHYFGVISGYRNINIMDRFLKLYGIDRSKLNEIDFSFLKDKEASLPPDPADWSLDAKLELGIKLCDADSSAFGVPEMKFIDKNFNKTGGFDITTHSYSELLSYTTRCHKDGAPEFTLSELCKGRSSKLGYDKITTMLREDSEVYNRFMATKKPVRRFDEFAIDYYAQCKNVLSGSEFIRFEDSPEDVCEHSKDRVDMKAVEFTLDEQNVEDVLNCDKQFKANSENWWDYIDRGYLCDPEIEIMNNDTLSRYSVMQELVYEYPTEGNLYRNWVMYRNGKFSLGLANKFIRMYKETGSLNAAIEATAFDFIVQAPVWMRRYYVECSRLEKIVGFHNVRELMTGLNPDCYALYMLLAHYLSADYYRKEDYIIGTTHQMYRASSAVCSYIINHSSEFTELKKLYTSSYDMQCFNMTGSLTALESSMLNIRNAQIDEDELMHFADLYAVRARHSKKNIDTCIRPMTGMYKYLEEVTRHPHTCVPSVVDSYADELRKIAVKVPDAISGSVMNRSFTAAEIRALIDRAITGSDKDKEDVYDILRKEFDTVFESNLRSYIVNDDKSRLGVLPDGSDVCIIRADVSGFDSICGRVPLDYETVRNSIPKWQGSSMTDRPVLKINAPVASTVKTYTFNDIKSMWNQYGGSRIFTRYDKAYVILLYCLMQKLKNPSADVSHLLECINKPIDRFGYYLDGFVNLMDAKNIMACEYTSFDQSERLNLQFVDRANLLRAWSSEYITEYMSTLQEWIQFEQFNAFDDVSHQLGVSSAEVERLACKNKELSSAIRDMKKEFQRKQSTDKSIDKDKLKGKKSKNKQNSVEVQILELQKELEARGVEIRDLNDKNTSLSESKQELSRSLSKCQKQVEELVQDTTNLGAALADARDEVTRLTEMQQTVTNVQPVSNIPIEAYINALKDKNIAIIGGDPTHKKLKNIGLPKLRLYSADKKSYTSDQIKSADLVIIITGFISHTAQDNVMSIVRANNVPLIRLESFSANKIVYEAFNAIYSKME